jgi:hypothetical protein
MTDVNHVAGAHEQEIVREGQLRRVTLNGDRDIADRDRQLAYREGNVREDLLEVDELRDRARDSD